MKWVVCTFNDIFVAKMESLKNGGGGPMDQNVSGSIGPRGVLFGSEEHCVDCEGIYLKISPWCQKL